MRKRLKPAFFITALLCTLISACFASYAETIDITLTEENSGHIQTSDDNFFKSFDGILPGETRHQDLNISNDYADNADFFFITEKPLFGNDELAAGITLHLTCGGELLYEGRLSEAAERIDLVRLSRGARKTVTISLTLPADAGDGAAGRRITTIWYTGADVYEQDCRPDCKDRKHTCKRKVIINADKKDIIRHHCYRAAYGITVGIKGLCRKAGDFIRCGKDRIADIFRFRSDCSAGASGCTAGNISVPEAGRKCGK
ncbi:MAG: hypothetical protein Q4E54_03640 [Lachnospiraceae bacterium]|nr:hypothetical protein [Lachnospiraceae bacterium]